MSMTNTQSPPGITKLSDFLTAVHLGYGWNFDGEHPEHTRFAVKYITVDFDTRFGDAWRITLRGGTVCASFVEGGDGGTVDGDNIEKFLQRENETFFDWILRYLQTITGDDLASTGDQAA